MIKAFIKFVAFGEVWWSECLGTRTTDIIILEVSSRICNM